jgi:hypothetical protein
MSLQHRDAFSSDKLLHVFRDSLLSGNVAGIFSTAAATLCGRVENRKAAPPVNAISHILWGGHPARHASRTHPNAVIGFVIHQIASIFWAFFYEAFFGKSADPKVAFLGGAAIASVAYVTDYHIVHRRLRPGFEICLSNRSLFLVYAALGAGYGSTALLRAKLWRKAVQRSAARHNGGFTTIR